ncbi:hypothetical protein TrLO_g9918 [Triparma laevis f. longispina]|uniref:AMP deaminase n=1 Tax=Triparma laevis f. longispina TaxID=1714387 RepID=A0A9W7DYV5_9STRA|nr:hypothetical protein TrLO_g9918 [Triparma laevis f. longispina]
MEHSTSAPEVGNIGASATPGKGWARLKKNLRTQRVVKQCCGVDMWEIDSFAEEMGQAPTTTQHDGEEHVKNIRKSMMVNSGVRPGGLTNHAPREITEALSKFLDMRKRYSDGRTSGSSIVNDAVPASECDLTIPDEAVMADLRNIWALSKNPNMAAFCRVRLSILESKFDVWSLEARDTEMVQQQALKNDFLTIPKVDTHLHNSAMMTAKQLSAFMHTTYEKDKDRVLREKDGKVVTVGEELLANGFSPNKRSTDELSGNHKMFANFENFNKGFTPLGSRALKSLFLGTSALDGEYLYELTKSCSELARDEADAFLEPRYSVYGNNRTGWSALAKWFRKWKVDVTIPSTLLAVQLPRVYPVWRKLGMVTCFGDMLKNFWDPLFEAAAEPEDSDSDMRYILKKLRVLDSVDDESKEDIHDIAGLPAPMDWTSEKNPPWTYYHYYMHLNLCKLNKLLGRESNPIQMRPHAGEAGPTHHLAAAFLLCDGISHGINLDKEPVLQYLYYLAQVPIAVSPISNSVLFLKYRDNPFPSMFKRGLCVALTTDDPLMFHSTPTPLLEEYATARHSFDLSSIDLCEIARYSCLAAFTKEELRQMYGDGEQHDPDKTNIPPMRINYRAKQLQEELASLK